jgi:endonuclease/exonuclease/phosphatase family metal-dependent hydrolase
MFVLLATVTSVQAEDEQGVEFRLLTYNVHALFKAIAKDAPRDRIPTIGWLANRYDVVLFQEDFEYSKLLAKQMAGSVRIAGNGMGWDARRVAAKVLIAPVAIFIPYFWPPYGDGITTFVDGRFALGESHREPFSECHGWFGANGDCWARKGFLRVRMELPHGGEIDVYNTHLESGPSDVSAVVRSIQLDQIAEAIERDSMGRAVIVGGDFNLARIRLGDRSVKDHYLKRLSLHDSGAGPELPFWRERDFVLFRDGDWTKLTVLASGEAQEFVNRGRALSDHPALFVRFRAEPIRP